MSRRNMLESKRARRAEREARKNKARRKIPPGPNRPRGPKGEQRDFSLQLAAVVYSAMQSLRFKRDNPTLLRITGAEMAAVAGARPIKKAHARRKVA